MPKRRMVYTFGAFHYDVAYRNTFEGYLAISFDAIQAGLRLLAKYPDYTFVIEQVILVREFLARLYPVFIAAGKQVPHLDTVLTLDSRQAEVMTFRRIAGAFEVSVCETRGTGGSVSLAFPMKVTACQRTDCTGKRMRGNPVCVKGKRIDLDLKPFEIVTLRLSMR